jgi:ATP-dependent exoDNAse (exonuclease V) beta subunit
LKEWTYFLKFVTDYPRLKPYRTEWMIYDEELKLAGSIDMVYENSDGTLSIYDWKRVKEITKTNGFNKHAVTECINYVPDTNFWHYSLQLNTYKTILERNYNKTVKELFLVRLYPEAYGYELVKVPIMTEMMSQLFELRRQQQTKM